MAPRKEPSLAQRTAVWIGERARTEPRRGLWQARLAWKIIRGVVAYPYIRVHARYRQWLDQRWRQRKLELLLQQPSRRRHRAGSARKEHRLKVRRVKIRIKPRPRSEIFLDRFETFLSRMADKLETARKLPLELTIHAFHRIVTRWPRPMDLSGFAPPPGLMGVLPPPEPDAPDLPLISIVTPSYNYGHFIEWTLRSILLQGYPKLEVIVMDGGSPDNTVDVIEKYRPWLKHAESEKDAGQADAVARGFKHATGDILAYLNSDDMLAPGALAFVAVFFQEHPEVDMVYGHRVIVDDSNHVTGHWVVPPHSDWYMQRWDYIPQETCFWRRSIYEKVGGIDPTYRFALDFDLFVRFMRAGAKICRANRFLGAFRVHEVSKTSSELQVGKVHPEVDRVWTKYKVQLARWQEMPAVGIREWIDIASRRFAASGKTLPGALSGVGYDYDRVWGGLLNSGEMPPAAKAYPVRQTHADALAPK